MLRARPLAVAIRRVSACVVLGASVVALQSCTARAVADTAEAQFDALRRGLLDRQDPGLLWDQLPTRYQDDVRAWCRELAAQMPAATYDKALGCVHALAILLKRRADFLAVNTPLKMLLQLIGQADEDDLAAAFTATGDMLLLLTRSDLGTAAKLATVDPGQFLHGTGREMAKRLLRVVRISGSDPLAVLRVDRVEVLRADATRTTLRVGIPAGGAPARTVELALVRLDDRWVPAELAAHWREIDAAVREFLGGLSGALGDSTDTGLLDEIKADLAALEQASTRTAFQRLLDRLIAKYTTLARGRDRDRGK
jgi:hypothetical protein